MSTTLAATGSRRLLYESAARVGTPTAVVQSSLRGERGGHFIIVVSAITATPSIVPTIEAYNDITDTWYVLLTGAAITATGTTILKVYPGITAVANASSSDILPQTWRVLMTHGDADSATYTVSANLIP